MRFTAEMRADISNTSKEVELTFTDTIRQAITFGLPIVRRKLKKPGRKK